MNTQNTTEKIAFLVAGVMGAALIISLIGIIVRAGKVPDATTSALLGVVMATLSSLPSLLAKLSSAPSGGSDDPISTTVDNTKKDPVPTTDVGDVKK